MGIKILFEHGRISGEDTPYGISVIAINQDNKNYCDVVSVFPFLEKLEKKELDYFFENLSYLIDTVSKGTNNPSDGVEYIEPISQVIRERYKDHF